MQWALVESSLPMRKFLPLTIDLRLVSMFGTPIFSPLTSSMYLRWFCEAAFENGLRFPLHPFFKCVLQHFNVCPTQLSPNFWGVLVDLLVFFRDKGLGVPILALLLDLFSVKEFVEGFLYISKRSSSRLIISTYPPLINSGRNAIFLLVAAIGNIIPLIRKISLAFRPVGPPLRTYVSSPLLQLGLIFGSPWVSLTLVWLCGFQVCGLILALRMKR